MTEATPKRLRTQIFQGLFSATDVAGISRWTYALLALLLILSTLWIMTAQLSSAVIINGSIKVYKNKLTLQHPEGGKIEAVHVQDGTRVREGQTLLTLSGLACPSPMRVPKP
jgi:multidrug efflux pump subunit AcrA (membrane-fusion protein)